MSDNKMIPGGISFGPDASPADRELMRRMLAGIPTLPHGRAAQDEVLRLRRRISSLEARLARVLGAAREWKFSAWELAGAPHGQRGHVWSGSRSRAKPGGR